MRILTGKRWITPRLKTCAGIRGFVQPVPEKDLPNGKTGAVRGPDWVVGDEVSQGMVTGQRILDKSLIPPFWHIIFDPSR
jgi:hypothetical protein